MVRGHGSRNLEGCLRCPQVTAKSPNDPINRTGKSAPGPLVTAGVRRAPHDNSRQIRMRTIVFLITVIIAAVAWPVVAAERSPISSPQISTNNNPKAVAAAKDRGAKTATKDIKAGVLRILYFGEPWSRGKPLVDETTGYRIQIVAGCEVGQSFVAEVDAYNRTMRDWHKKTRGQTKSKLSKTEAIRLAAECVRGAEPHLEMDTRSARVVYYRNSKAYGGQSLWLVAFPYHRSSAQKEPPPDERSQKPKAFRMVWVKEDGSYSGNVVGELPSTNPPIWLGPDEEVKAIELAEDFIQRRHPELDVGQKPATATYYADMSTFGGGPLWIVGFAIPAPKDKNGRLTGVRPFWSKAVLLKSDGLVVDGAIHTP